MRHCEWAKDYNFASTYIIKVKSGLDYLGRLFGSLSNDDMLKLTLQSYEFAYSFQHTDITIEL